MHSEELDQGGESLGSTAYEKQKSITLLRRRWNSEEHIRSLKKTKNEGLVFREKITPEGRTRTKDWQHLTSPLWPHSYH